ncbi:MAG TPA: FAD-binding oxidoreductase [Alphaproteobacteria bacterium]|nr:FAD-binding oxidoreductase [Alphaproteobacteria bacterium]
MDETALPPPRFGVEGRIAALENLSPGVTAVRVAVESGPLIFAPGQYVAMSLPEQPPRDYSLTWRSAPDELEFFVRDHGVGGTSTFIAERLRVRDSIRFDGPFGTMPLALGHEGPLLCIAASTGIGPVTAIAKAAGELAPEREVQLYWGAAKAEDLFLVDDIAAALPLDGRLVLSAEDVEPDNGMIRAGNPVDAVSVYHGVLEGWGAVAAGPPVMVEAAAVLIQSLGLAPENFHADAFFTQKDKQPK